MKTAWRAFGRYPESEIYRALSVRPGLAEFVAGGDVQFPAESEASGPISVQSLRDPASCGDSNADKSPILHRLLIKDVGRALWTYTTDLELLRGIRLILNALHSFAKDGIVHRDISPGNVLLPERDADGHPVTVKDGILHDVEFALLPNTLVPTTTMVDVTLPASNSAALPSIVQTHTRWAPPKHGAEITGTLVFMAHEVVQAIVDRAPLQQTASHDLESLAYVLFYAVLRHVRIKVQNKRDDAKTVGEALNVAFGHHSVSTVLGCRESLSATAWVVSNNTALRGILRQHLSEPVRVALATLNLELSEILRDNRRRLYVAGLHSQREVPGYVEETGGHTEPSRTLSYETFSDIIDQAIEDLKAAELA